MLMNMISDLKTWHGCGLILRPAPFGLRLSLRTRAVDAQSQEQGCPFPSPPVGLQIRVHKFLTAVSFHLSSAESFEDSRLRHYQAAARALC